MKRNDPHACALTIAALAFFASFASFTQHATAAPRRPYRPPTREELVVDQPDFDVVIAGGSTAAFAAAIAAAESGARTALLEPTDWVGGQITSSGVPAIDEAWHTIRDPNTKRELLSVANIARTPANIPPDFRKMLEATECGECWVSRFCFRPDVFLDKQLLPLQKRAGDRLVVFLNTVVKQVATNKAGTQIESLTAIRRTPKKGIANNGYDELPSKDLRDWYSTRDSDRFKKETLRFNGLNQAGRTTIFIDATEWGELLALADAPYLIGTEAHEGDTHGNDRCGQATVFCFVEQYQKDPVDEPERGVSATDVGFGEYKGQKDAWQKIWTYRRLQGHGTPAVGDLCLQNWGYSEKTHEGGNDYPFGYLFKSKKDTAAERSDWHGGIDLAVLAAAERRALAWHEWFKNHTPPEINSRQITLAPEVMGTGHGLAKLPYIRDTRRSIGLDNYLLKFDDITGDPAKQTGTVFEDRIALGAYPADVHPIITCQMPEFVREAHDTLPFYIPFRALTNAKVENMLVAGKTMAQTFLVNSATREQPTEWSTGTAAGVAAAYMAQHAQTSRAAYQQSLSELQRLIAKRTPIDWTIPDDQNR